MALYLLSARELVSNVSYDPIFELEDILIQSCQAQLLTPTARQMTQWAQHQIPPVGSILNKLLYNTVSFYKPIQSFEPLSNESNTLIVVALNGRDLNLLSSLPNWRQQFDQVVAYVFDGWIFESYPSHTRQLDHIFVPMPEIIEPLQAAFKVPVTLLPFGADVLTHGSSSLDRPIDLISYGRIPQQYQSIFARYFNCPQSGRIYYRSTPRPPQRFPQQPYLERRDRLDSLQLYNLLRHSKLAIAFDTLYPGMRRFPYSFVTIRWFQCGAAGCAIVGKPPTTPLAGELLNWRDAAIELPDDPIASVEFIENLLSDQSRLCAIHQRNYLENLSRHDWRYRIEQMLNTVGMALPSQLTDELSQLKSLCAQAAVAVMH